jgi:prolyl-tRNA editing enzyme YbaK/EbsC (Cys-tRNA(Pro) deacylase)
MVLAIEGFLGCGGSLTKENPPVIRAIYPLRENGVCFAGHLYRYLEKEGALGAARTLGSDEHRVIKTLVMGDDQDLPLVVLMHDDRQLSTKGLARAMGSKRVNPLYS